MVGNVLAQGEQQPPPPPLPSNYAVDPHHHSRAIIRLIQCSQCSLPLRTPMTLPCGNSICRKCLPASHKRENISYPMTANRQEGFLCAFPECGMEHSLGDCSQDVTLSKIMERISIEVARWRPKTPSTPILLDERPRWRNVIDSSKEKDIPHSRVLHGGRLVATYTFADIGELKYSSEVAYQTMSPVGDSFAHMDKAFLAIITDTIRTEMECQVCYNLMLDPLTTTCGHTYCRKCVTRVLDHSTSCPTCRRALPTPLGLISVPGNQRLTQLIENLCPDLVAARRQSAAQEDSANVLEGKNVPLFVCTLAYPSMPTFLHIFEPRYRLMIRRAIESGERKFGMIMYNRRGEPQGDLGLSQFMLYGTLLHIISMQMMPDGRSLIETRGLSRFRVKDWDMLDGYIVGSIERLDDVSLAEEEQIEARETSSLPLPRSDSLTHFDHMSTYELLRIGLDFIARMRAASAPWLHESVLESYGSPPDDPALFPYWLASILPIAEEEKYKLLPTVSVRERLKITARWVRRIEAQRW